VLSRQLRAFEDELGLPLFRRGTTLTRAGRQLLDDARPLLVSAQALRRVAVAARGPMFTIGFMPGITVTSAVRTMQTRHPDLEVRLLRTDWFNQVEVLLARSCGPGRGRGVLGPDTLEDIAEAKTAAECVHEGRRRLSCYRTLGGRRLMVAP
jgi:hypothetical protein